MSERLSCLTMNRRPWFSRTTNRIFHPWRRRPTWRRTRATRRTPRRRPPASPYAARRTGAAGVVTAVLRAEGPEESARGFIPASDACLRCDRSGRSMASGPSTTGATAGSPTPPPRESALPLRLWDLDVATGRGFPEPPPPPSAATTDAVEPPPDALPDGSRRPSARPRGEPRTRTRAYIARRNPRVSVHGVVRPGRRRRRRSRRRSGGGVERATRRRRDDPRRRRHAKRRRRRRRARDGVFGREEVRVVQVRVVGRDRSLRNRPRLISSASGSRAS